MRMGIARWEIELIEQLTFRYYFSLNFVTVTIFFPVKRRPYISHELSNFNQIGAVALNHAGFMPPPMALSFCKVGSWISSIDHYVLIGIKFFLFQEISVNHTIGLFFFFADK